MEQKSKGLNLTKYIAPEEEITVGDIKLKIKGTVPDEMFDDLQEVRKIDENKLTSKDMTYMLDITKKLLVFSGSKEADVDKVFKILNTDGKTELITFIGNFLKACYGDIKDPSKKIEDVKKKGTN